MTATPWVEAPEFFEKYLRSHALSDLREYLSESGSPNSCFGLTSLLHAACVEGDVEAV